MSVFRAFIREQLAKRDQRWAAEWDDVFRGGQVDAVLRKVKDSGADPDFCLYLIVEYRWRALQPLRPAWQRERLLRAVTTLGNASLDWKQAFQRETSGFGWQQVQDFFARTERLLRSAKRQDQQLIKVVTRMRKATTLERRLLQHATQGMGLRVVQQFLSGAEESLRSITALDEGAFSVTTAAHPPQKSVWTSEQQSTCLSLLDRHLKHASGRNRTSRRILAELLGQFGFLPDGLRDPERWVEKRLERLSPETKMPLMIFYDLYHLLHKGPKAPCTGACKLQRSVLADGARQSENEDKLFLGGHPRSVKSRVRRPSKRDSRGSSRPRRGKLKRRTRKTLRRTR